jgi:hypothetical protein
VILLAAALLLVAVGLLAGGLAQGSSLLEWSSFGASALAALVLAAGEVRQRLRRRAARAPEAPGGRREPVAAAVPTQPAEVEGTAPGLAAPVEERPVAVRDVRPPQVPGPQTGRHGAPDPEPDVRPLDATPPVPPPATPPVPPPAVVDDGVPAGATAWVPAEPAPLAGEPPTEDVEFTDLLMIMDLTDEVLVVDEHPRYHLAGCPHVAGLPTVPVRLDQARADGFTPCGTCAPDRTLAARERARRG